MLKTVTLTTLMFALLSFTGCANNQQTASTEADENPLTGDYPADSAFATLKRGMSMNQVHDILGEPTDSKTYTTGKAWIPFYYGRDVARYEETYKGIGILTYTGAGVGGVHWKLYKAKYDPSEDGYIN